ncbi:hypothetical protein [Sphingobium sp. TomTYG45]
MIHYRALFEELVHEPGEPDGMSHMTRPSRFGDTDYGRRDLH